MELYDYICIRIIYNNTNSSIIVTGKNNPALCKGVTGDVTAMAVVDNCAVNANSLDRVARST